MTPYLTRPEAAQFLTERGFTISKNTLMKMASAGGGPIYRIFGHRAVYAPNDLLSWAEAKLSSPRRSTSELVEV